MPVDTSIYNGLLAAPKSAQEYQNEFLAGQQQRQAIQQNAIGLQTGQMKLQDAQRVLGEQEGARNAISGLGATATPDQQVAALRAQGTPTALTMADTLATSYGNQLKSKAGAAKDTADAEGKTQANAIEAHQQRLQKLSYVNTPEDLTQWVIDDAKSDPTQRSRLGGALSAIQEAAQDPTGAALQKLKASIQQSGQAVQQQLEFTAPKPQEMKLGNRSFFVDVNPNSPTHGQKITAVEMFGQSPDSVAEQAGQDRRSAAGIAKDYAIAGLDSKGQPLNGTGLLDDATIANAAARYNTDGTLPPNLGRGQQGPREIASILKEAAAQAAARGDTPEAQRVAQLANKANSAALNKLQTQQTMVGAFEKNFTKNADMAEQLSSSVDRTGVPLVNKWINAGKRSITGDADLAAFDTSVKATVNEYAKIVSGATGSAGAAQGEISKIEGLLSAAQTPQQVSSVLNLMRKETQNRMSAFDDEKSQLTNSMIRPTGKPKPATSSDGWHVEVVK